VRNTAPAESWDRNGSNPELGVIGEAGPAELEWEKMELSSVMTSNGQGGEAEGRPSGSKGSSSG
jgi:hypothetical protein